MPAKSIEALATPSCSFADPGGGHGRVVERVASVKNRPSSRRISAAELEHLMTRQQNGQAYDQVRAFDLFYLFKMVIQVGCTVSLR